MTYDTIVIGIGGMGSAAAFHLARRGLRVLAFERFALPHDLGSSHGVTRIIRLAYYEHPSYVPLLRRAFALWRDLERESGTRLLHVTGAVDAGPPGSRVFEGSRLSCEVHDLPHEVLTSAELSRRFPAFHLPAEHLAVVQPDGGFLLPERCIETHVRLARAHGADVRTGVRVTRWEAAASGVVVHVDGETHRAPQLVVTAGPWVPSLVPTLAPHLVVERQVVAWFSVTEPEHFVPGRFPVFVMNADEGHFYGFPEFGVPGFKIGKYHHRGEAVDPDRIDRAVHGEDIAPLHAFVGRYFPGGAGPLLKSSVCMFTNTPDEHFLIDRLPDAPQVVIVSACSGHGFKFTSVIGEIVADLVQRDFTAHDIALHGLSRLPT
ncbi:MAG TPA: N-methyl-L-tryptophan oxidase [Gemmatimonadaceae bacterium]|nr:N-methyl-L-tryptophan oxidase [Gemmatimonadaceae bacterium]